MSTGMINNLLCTQHCSRAYGIRERQNAVSGAKQNYLGKIIAFWTQSHDSHISAIIAQIEIPLHTQIISVKALQDRELPLSDRRLYRLASQMLVGFADCAATAQHPAIKALQGSLDINGVSCWSYAC